jgi:hypothetical protein
VIIDTDIHPKKNLYFLGAIVIEQFKLSKRKKVDIDSLYSKLLLSAQYDISYDYFLLSLDWLYILGLVKLDSQGKINKCF